MNRLATVTFWQYLGMVILLHLIVECYVRSVKMNFRYVAHSTLGCLDNDLELVSRPEDSDPRTTCNQEQIFKLLSYFKCFYLRFIKSAKWSLFLDPAT